MIIRQEKGRRGPKAQDVEKPRKSAKINENASRRVLECLNLKPMDGTDGTMLCPAGQARVIATGAWMPLTTDGETLIVADGCDVAAIYEGAAANVPELICTLDSAPRCAMVADDEMTVMTAGGPWLLRRGADGRWANAGGNPVWPEVSITRAPKAGVSTTIAGGTMAQTAARAMEAYRRLCEQANGAGCWMQPVLARCRILDTAGNVLHVTAPVAVMPPEGAQLAGPWVLNADATTENASADTVISADTFGLRVKTGACEDAAVLNRAATLEVQVSPEFHTIDPGGTATAAVTRHASERRVSVTMPGAGRALTGGGRAAAAEQRLRRACAMMDKLAVTVARISNPFGHALSVDLSAPAVSDVAKASDDLEKALGTPAEAPEEHEQIAAPHSFSARHVAVNGQSAVWADVDVLPYGGYGPESLAATTGTRGWSGSVRVDFSDGTYVVRECGGSYEPLTLWPVLSYPSGRACRLRMTWQATGDSLWHSVDVELKADSSGRCACYVHPTLLPFAPDSGKTATGTPVRPVRRMKGHVAVTAATGAADVTALVRACPEVTAVKAARNGGGAWDYGRARFYVFGTDGTRLLITGKDRRTASVNLLSTDRPAHAACIADAGERVLALCDGRITAFSGTSVKTLCGGVKGDRLGYDAEADEIVTADTDDNEARVYLPQRDMAGYSITLESGGPWLARDGRIWAVCGGSLCEVSRRPIVATGTAIRWNARIEGAGGLRRMPRGVQWMINGRDIDAVLKVRRTPLNGRTPLPATVCAVTVSGDVLSPLRMRLGGHAPCALTALIEGTVGPDFAMTAPIFTFETGKSWK